MKNGQPKSIRRIILPAILCAIASWSCSKPMDFLVQNLSVSLAPSVRTALIQLPNAIDPAHSRIIGTGQVSQSAALGTPAPDVETRDLAVHIEIISASTVRVTGHPERAESTSLNFSILSYVGSAGGPNEFTVVARGVIDVSELDPSDEYELTISSLGIADSSYDKLTVQHTASIEAADATTFDEGDLETANGWASAIVDDSFGDPAADRKVVFKNNAIFSPRAIAYEIIDWNGSNWQIERPNTGPGRSAERFADPGTLAGGVPTAFPINSIGNWDHAWIESNRATPVGAQTDGTRGAVVYQGATPSEVLVLMPIQQGGVSTPPNDHGFYVISNPEIYVLHQGMPLGDSSVRLDNNAVAQVFPLKEPNQINLGSDQVVSLAYGFWDRLESATPGDDSQGVGTAGITAIFSPPSSVVATKSVPSGWWYHYLQTIQFFRSEEPDSSLLQSVVYEPEVSITFEGQR